MLHGRIWIIAVEFPHRVRIKFRPLTHIYGQNSPSALATQLLGWGAAHSPLSHRSRPSRASPKKHRWLFAPAHSASALGLNFPPGSPNGQANLHGYFSFFLSIPPITSQETILFGPRSLNWQNQPEPRAPSPGPQLSLANIFASSHKGEAERKGVSSS